MTTIQYCYTFLDDILSILQTPIVLSLKDQKRLMVITHPMRKVRFIVGRLLLQRALQKAGVFVPLAAITSGSAGHPYVVSYPSYALSATRSNRYVAVACSCNGLLGIDSEYKKLGRPILAIAKLFFDDNSYKRIVFLPYQEQISAFYILWLAKEVCYKAGVQHFEIGTMKNWWDDEYAHGVWFSKPADFVRDQIPCLDLIAGYLL